MANSSKLVNVISPSGRVESIPEDRLEDAQANGWMIETPEAQAQRLNIEDYGNRGWETAAKSAVSTATFGLSDLALKAAGDEDIEKQREFNPTANIVGTVGGMFLPGAGTVAGALGGLAGHAAGGAVKFLEGAGIAGKVAKAAISGGVHAGAEGAVFGVGNAVSELSLSDEPITAEHVASTLFHSVAHGAKLGFELGAGAGVIGLGVKSLVSKAAEQATKAAAIKAEEAATKEGLLSKLYDHAGSAEKSEAFGDIARFEKAPKDALAPLRAEASALKSFISRADEAMPATRQAARLEENLALQESIKSFSETAAKAESSIIGKIGSAAKGAAFGLATKASLPFLGPLAPLVGAKASGFVGTALPRLEKALGEAAIAGEETIHKAAESFVKVGERAGHTILEKAAEGAFRSLPAATKVLESTSYAHPGQAVLDSKYAPTEDKQLSAFRARENEIRSMTMAGPAGTMVMTPAARAGLFDQLAGLRAISPKLADNTETLIANKMGFIASKLPTRPALSGPQFGPDRWQPSKFEIAKFARYVAAAENPDATMHRVANGTLTPEDAETLRVVYPEKHNALKMAIMKNVANIQHDLPYERKLSMSILFQVPADPAMDPQILSVLQASHEQEPGTEGGTVQPKAQAQFGSVSKPEPTTAQQRAG